MKKIQRLAPHVAERIAAGEMIERPSSVVKELVENSLDAGCTEIRVVLEDGGKGLIEVTDNGCGMSPEDLEVSVERHATSKLTSLEDLEKIATLGFRGEALPSIAAVSDLSILTRESGASSAFEFNLGDLTTRFSENPKPQKITFGQFIDSSHGTRIRAVGLFSQVPARLKFLKSQSAEVSQVREWLERLSLAYPHVGFHLVSDDRTLINFRPQSEEDRAKAILSDGDSYPLVHAAHEQDGFRDLGFQARIYWLRGASTPNSRNLIQVVNSRAVRDRMLQQAILAPFRQALLPGQFPAVALIIRINPAAIDVNVHPTKSEIRFLDSRKIFQSIDALVKSMMSQQRPSPSLAFETPLSQQRISADAPTPYIPWTQTERSSSELTEFPARSSSEFWQAKETPSIPPHRDPIAPPLHPLNEARFVGALFNTYLVYEQGPELLVIDQHAAHERIRYEKLKQRLGASDTRPRDLSSQALLLPEVVRFSEENRSSLEERLPWLVALGFESEIFGTDSLLFRAVPTEWGSRNLKIRLKNLVDRLLNADAESRSLILDENLFESLASEACHSSVRAGDLLEIEEIQSLVKQLFECEHPWNCPHGRPTLVKIPQGKLEEWFQRRV